MSQLLRIHSAFGKLLVTAAIAMTASHTCQGQGYTISTLAGDPRADVGDGGPATKAFLGNPSAVAVDGGGNVYIAEGIYGVIRKVSPSGVITTIAGSYSNSLGHSGDGGPALNAQLDQIRGLAMDAAGNLYVSEYGGECVRKIAVDGTITTVVGRGPYAVNNGDGGPATLATLSGPEGIALDSAGNLYIADYFHSRVRKVATNGTITTVAGGGYSSGASSDGGPATSASMLPVAVAVDVAGNLYISDQMSNQIRKVSPAGTISTVAGSGAGSFSGDGGAATSAGMSYPEGLAFDSAGNLFIADRGDARVRMVSAGGTITTVAGNGAVGYSGDGGPATSARLASPVAVAVDSRGRVYAADWNSGNVRMLTGAAPTSTPSIKAGGVVSAGAFGTFSAVAPGSWIEVYGSNLAGGTRSWSGSDFNGVNAPSSLDGTSVTIGGQKAFIDFISPGQVNAQVPSTVGTGTQQVVVTTAAGSSSGYSLTVASEQPGLLAPAAFSVGGKQYVTALFNDGATFVLPPGAITGLNSRRAQPGEVITLYGIGFGAVTPAIAAGQVVQQSNALAAPLHVMFGQTEATVSYAGLAPNAVGLYQFNVVVPNVSTSDSIPLTFLLGGAPSKQTLYIAIQNGAPLPQVQSLSLSAATVPGGASVNGTVVLNTAAPAGGASVSLTSNSTYASVPATVTVPAGGTTAAFAITTTVPGSNQAVTITAAYGGSSAQAALTVTPAASGGVVFSALTASFTYQPVGAASATSAFQVTPDAGNTYTALAGGGTTFIKGSASNQGQTFAFNTIDHSSGDFFPGFCGFVLGTKVFFVSTGSLTFTLDPTTDYQSSSYTSGKVTGTLTLTGTWGDASTVTLTGGITGTYSMKLK